MEGSMNRIPAGVVATLYLKGRASVVMHVGAVCSAFFALVCVPDARAQEGPGQTTQSQDLNQPSSGQESQWLQPVPTAGAPIRITERSGKSTTGRLVEVLPSAVRLVSGGITLEVPVADIALVQRNGDSLWNGVGAGAAIAGAISLGNNGGCVGCYSAGELAANRLAVAGIGAGVGALLDLLVRDKRILYRAQNTTSAPPRPDIQPIPTGQRRGLRLSRNNPNEGGQCIRCPQPQAAGVQT